MTYFIGDKSYPLASRDELLDQISSLRKKFIKYEDYSDATLQDIGSEEQLEKSYRFKATMLQSSWLENIEGKDFTLRPLPELAQLSSVNGFLFENLDDKDDKELLIAGNFFPFKPQLGRNDASMGLILKYRNGEINVEKGMRSQVWLSGDVRDIAVLHFKNGIKRIVVSRNNDRASVLSLKE